MNWRVKDTRIILLSSIIFFSGIFFTPINAFQESKIGSTTKIYFQIYDSLGVPTVSADCKTNIINNTGSVIEYGRDVAYLTGTNGTYYFNTSADWGNTTGDKGLWLFETNCTVGSFQAYEGGSFILTNNVSWNPDISLLPIIIACLGVAVVTGLISTKYDFKDSLGLKFLFTVLCVAFMITSMAISLEEVSINNSDSSLDDVNGVLAVAYYALWILMILLIVFFLLALFTNVFDVMLKRGGGGLV